MARAVSPEQSTLSLLAFALADTIAQLHCDKSFYFLARIAELTQSLDPSRRILYPAPMASFSGGGEARGGQYAGGGVLRRGTNAGYQRRPARRRPCLNGCRGHPDQLVVTQGLTTL